MDVPQGSILGPLFFINESAFYLIHIVIKLFADDTTLIIAEQNLDTYISKFNSAILSIIGVIITSKITSKVPVKLPVKYQ